MDIFGRLLDVFLDRVLELLKLREAFALPFGEDRLPVDGHFEGPAFTGDQRDSLGPLGKGAEKFLRRPRGACGVVSRDAVGECDRQLSVFRHEHTSWSNYGLKSAGPEHSRSVCYSWPEALGSFTARITTKPFSRATVSELPNTCSTCRLRLSRRLMTR